MTHTRTNKAVWLKDYRRWQIKVQKDGVRKTFTSSQPGRDGQNECHRRADAWLAASSLYGNPRVRVADAFSRWLAELKTTTSYDHHKQYSYYANNYILPRIGMLLVSQLNDQCLQEILNHAFASRGLAHKTLSNIRGCIKSFLKYCRKNKFTTYEPESLYIPHAAQKGKRQILSPQEFRVLFTSDETTFRGLIRHDFYINAYRAQVLSGFRPGELIALTTKSDLDYALATSGSINIHGEHTGGKNDNAHRSVTVSLLLRQVLRDQKALLKKRGIRSKYLFPAPNGKPIKETTYCDNLKRYCKHNKITVVTPYELRHTFVSIAKNLPEGMMKSLVGHSPSMDTYGVYSHALSNDDEIRAELLDSVFLQLVPVDADGNVIDDTDGKTNPNE